MKKIKIHRIDDNNDYQISGIICDKPDYWLALNLNRSLQINLVRTEDFPKYNPKTKSIAKFPFFHCSDEWERKIYLLANKSRENILFPTYKHFDYFLLFEKFTSGIDDINNAVRQIPGITACIPFPFESIPENKYFAEDLEMHLLDVTE